MLDSDPNQIVPQISLDLASRCPLNKLNSLLCKWLATFQRLSVPSGPRSPEELDRRGQVRIDDRWFTVYYFLNDSIGFVSTDDDRSYTNSSCSVKVLRNIHIFSTYRIDGEIAFHRRSNNGRFSGV